MAKLTLKYIQKFKDRHGKIRYYFRRAPHRVPLPGEPGSRDFMDAYASALSLAAEKPHSREGFSTRSFHNLIAQYYRTPEFKALRPSTQRSYRNQLERFRHSFGSLSVKTLKPYHLETLFLSMAETPHAAANLRKRLNRVLALAVRLGWRDDNPAKATEGVKTKGDGITAWSDAEIQAFRQHWPSGSKARLAFELFMCTGQRRSDVVTMGKQHIKDGRICIRQIKTGHQVWIPILDELEAEITQCQGLTFLLTPSNKPYTVDGFGNWFRERCREAGIDKTPHGLRKATARRLAEAGCTANEIPSVLGHRTLNEVARYTQSVDQMKLSDRAIAKIATTKA